MSEFKLTAKQLEAQHVIAGDSTHIMLFGGSRSGKTALHVRNIILRALKAPGSRHAILRFRFNHVKSSIVLDTFPKIMSIAFPGVEYTLDKTDWYAKFENKSEIWFGGLDDKERTEKILGQEYCVDPDSRVLTADLKWIAAKDVQVGQELIGFPEHLSGHLKLIPTFVERHETVKANKYKVVTTHGKTIVSEHHKFVSLHDDRRHKNFRLLSWKETKDLKVGDKIRFTAKPWDTGETKNDGWFAGMLDGEGWVSRAARMSGVAQCEGVCLDDLKSWLDKNEIKYYDRVGTGKQGKKGPCHKLNASGLWPSLRMLGIAQPKRLDYRAIWEDCRAFTAGGYDAEVLSITPIGVGDVVSMGTTTKTFIADGFLAHNCTIYLNECSQIPFSSREMAVTRLAQKVMTQIEGREPTPLKPRMLYDMNPGSNNHWTYRLFIKKVDPDSGKPLANPQDYAYFKINPGDNVENLSDGYLKTLEGLSARLRQRFLYGDFSDANPNALFDDAVFEKWRVIDGKLPDFVRVIVGVDPSGSGDTDNADNDAIGIVVGALGVDGNAYLLEDITVKAGPATWGKIATDAYERHEADAIVGESNYGGDMVRFTIKTCNPRVNFKDVKASRGKVVRAEPFSALYEQGKIRHVGYLTDLEDEMAGFTTNGYIGEKSPNRADAAIWVLAELFPAIVSTQGKMAPIKYGKGAFV